MIMLARYASGLEDSQASGHAEVNDQRPFSGAYEQVFGTAADFPHGRALDVCAEISWYRPAQAPVTDNGTEQLETPAQPNEPPARFAAVSDHSGKWYRAIRAEASLVPDRLDIPSKSIPACAGWGSRKSNRAES